MVSPEQTGNIALDHPHPMPLKEAVSRRLKARHIAVGQPPLVRPTPSSPSNHDPLARHSGINTAG